MSHSIMILENMKDILHKKLVCVYRWEVKNRANILHKTNRELQRK